MPTSTYITGGNVDQEVRISDGSVVAAVESLKIDVRGFKYDIGGVRGIFTGALAQSVTNNDTNYVYIDDTGTLQINTTGFANNVSYIPLARVVTASGEIVAIYEERVLLASSAAAEGTCRIGFPVDGGIIGGNAAVSSNNGIASVTFAATGESRNRWNIRPPQNYISGDLTFRCYGSVSGSPGSNAMRVGLYWQGLADGEALPTGDYDNNSEFTFSLSGVSSDTLFDVNVTISSATFNKSDDLLALYFYRNADHAEDTTSLIWHTHICELRYTGYKVAGQAGQ